MAKAVFSYDLRAGDGPDAPWICPDIDCDIECTVSRDGGIESIDSIVVNGVDLLKTTDELARGIGERIRLAALDSDDFRERALEDAGLVYHSSAPWNGHWAEVA